MKKSFLFILFTFLIFVANAQKLPSVQTASIKAPVDVKVDGKPNEWHEMQAYNHATDIAYTVANDANNLYLVIQTKDPAIITRIVYGRVTFTINKADKKSEDKAVAISYPVFEKGNKATLALREKLTTPKIADSVMLVNNQRIETTAKLIKVTGISGMDTLISVYNDNGIKASSRFDANRLYTCELSVSLKLLGLSAADAAKFAYNIRLNGISYDDMPGVNIVRNASGQITSIDIHKDESIPNAGNLTAPTDFWGEYTLVK